MKSPAAQRATNITSLVLCGILAGVVVAAAAFPLVGSVGLSAKAASESFEDLPGDLKAGPPPLTSKVYDAKGGLITTFFDENREDIPFAKIPKVMQDAIIAAEDHRFWTHKGTDPKGIVRAFVSNIVSTDSGSQGGSTLTQQYVKQALYYSAKTKEERDAAIAPTGARKVQELKYAVSLEKKLSKQDIMQRYLNIANFGNGNYGVSAAARGYFNKTPDKLTVAEAALLASTVKNPSKFNPVKGDKESAKQRRDFIISAMGELDLVKDEEAEAAIKQPITLNVQKPRRKCENGNIKYGFYCGWFLDWWKANPQFGKTVEEREENLFKGGYRIGTALDPKIQAAAQESIDSKLPRNSKFALGIVVIEPGTGQVKAMAVNRTYGLEAPKTTAPLLSGGGSTDGYQAGSTFKMFTMVAALEKGMPLSTAIHSPERYTSKYVPGSCDGNFCPKNASPAMTGTQTMWSGFGESANTYFIQLEERVSVKASVQAAEKLGVKLRSKVDLEQRAAAFKSDIAWGSFTLGVAQTTPLDMANAYATVAARGLYCEPTPLRRITDKDGKVLPYSAKRCKQVISKEVADAAADAARCPVGDNAAGACTHPGGGRTASRVGGGIPGPVAGKSGTTDGKKGTPTAWLVGFTPTLAAAAFVANPKAAEDSVDHLTRRPADIFIDTMKVAVEDAPKKQFVRPTDAMAFGVRVTVPDVEGDTVEEAKAILTEAGFTPIVEERKVGSQHPAGTVARTDPDGGSRSNKGGAVTIFVSNGTGQDDPDPDQPGDGTIFIPENPNGNGNGPGREPDGDGD
jgi:membrane peptidoglycan carboxypeptidase